MAAIHGRFTRSQILIQNGNADWVQCAGLFSLLLLLAFFANSVSPAPQQAGKLIVWISMAILLSTLLLSTATNC